MNIEVNIPVQVTKKQYNRMKVELAELVFHKIDKTTQPWTYWVKPALRIGITAVAKILIEDALAEIKEVHKSVLDEHFENILVYGYTEIPSRPGIGGKEFSITLDKKYYIEHLGEVGIGGKDV